MRPHFKLCAVVSALLFSSLSHAQAITATDTVFVSRAANVLNFGVGSGGSAFEALLTKAPAFSAGVVSGDAVAVSSASASIGNGMSAEFAVARTVGAAEIADASVALLRIVPQAAMVGLAMYGIYQGYRLAKCPGAPSICHDSGDPAERLAVPWYFQNLPTAYKSAQEACVANAGCYGSDGNFTYTSCSATASMNPGGHTATCYRTWSETNGTDTYTSGGPQQWGGVSDGPPQMMQDPCPAYVDFFKGNSVPAGGPRGKDGKCPTGNYSPISDADARPKIVEGMAGGEAYKPSDAPKAVEDAVKAGVPVQPKAGTSPTVSTPTPTVSGQPGTTTTTGPSGSESTTKTPSATIQCNGMACTVRDTSTTSTTKVDATTGQSTTTTKTNDTPAGGTPADQPPGLCDLFPDISACAKLGSADQVDMPQRTIDINFSPMTGFGPATGSCPQHTVTYLGQSIEIDLGLVCNFMGMMRPFVLAVAGIVASFIFIGAVRKG